MSNMENIHDKTFAELEKEVCAIAGNGGKEGTREGNQSDIASDIVERLEEVKKLYEELNDF